MGLIDTDLNRRSVTFGGAITSYSTTFSLTENPISEGGLWHNSGLDWTVVRTSGGIAYGTQTSGGYDDSYANLSMVSGNDTEIITKISKGSTRDLQEVEHHHRCSDGPHFSKCYEIFIAHDGGYCDFVEWLGTGTSISDYRYVVPSFSADVPGGVNDGDLFKSTVVGNVLSAWIDHGSGWVLCGSFADTAGPGGGAALLSGCVGIGFFLNGAGTSNQFGITDFSARVL